MVVTAPLTPHNKAFRVLPSEEFQNSISPHLLFCLHTLIVQNAFLMLKKRLPLLSVFLDICCAHVPRLVLVPLPFETQT